MSGCIELQLLQLDTKAKGRYMDELSTLLDKTRNVWYNSAIAEPQILHVLE